jgi:hypothetical protein
MQRKREREENKIVRKNTNLTEIPINNQVESSVEKPAPNIVRPGII